MKKEDILQKCMVDGFVVRLPDIQLDRKLYLEVSKSLELIGGKWNRKSYGFIFKEDPTDLLNQISKGDKINLKKQFQFFATPEELSNKLVELAEIKSEHIIYN
jgi:hypothetical protein